MRGNATTTMLPADERRLEALIGQWRALSGTDRAEVLKDIHSRARRADIRSYLMDSLYLLFCEKDAESKKAEAENEVLKYDSLSGAATRTYYDRNADHILGRAQSYGGTQAYVLVDIDDFKTVNDKYGHPAGDDLLRTFGDVARSVLSELGSTNLFVRNGGDEFLFVLDGASRDSAEAFAEELQHRFKDETSRREYAVQTFSCGIALYSQDGADVQTLIRNADRRVYLAKKSGGDCIRSRNLELISQTG